MRAFYVLGAGFRAGLRGRLSGARETVKAVVTDLTTSERAWDRGRSRSLISYEEYGPYGSTAYRAQRSGEVSGKRYRFTGMEKDEETGLSYHHHRFLAVWLGRWCSSDPIGLGGGINRWAYCSGNPILSVDPSGLGEPDPGKIASDIATEWWSYVPSPGQVVGALQAKAQAAWNNPLDTAVTVGYAVLPGARYYAHPIGAPLEDFETLKDVATTVAKGTVLGVRLTAGALVADQMSGDQAAYEQHLPAAAESSGLFLTAVATEAATAAAPALIRTARGRALARSLDSPPAAGLSPAIDPPPSHTAMVERDMGDLVSVDLAPDPVAADASAWSAMGPADVGSGSSVRLPLADSDIVVAAGAPTPNSLALRPADYLPVAGVTEPGKSASLATTLDIRTEIPQMFGRSAKPGDLINAGFVGDIRAAGFDAVWAPTRGNNLHVRIVSADATFNEPGRAMLSLAFDPIERVNRSGNVVKR